MSDKEKCADWGMCPIGVQHTAQIEELRHQVKELKEWFSEAQGDIREIRDLLLNRPTWGTTLTITTLTGMLVTAVMYIVTHL